MVLSLSNLMMISFCGLYLHTPQLSTSVDVAAIDVNCNV